MILKRDLLAGIDANTEQIIWQGEMITELKRRVSKLEKELSAKKHCVKTKAVKSVNASKQPRDKSGKFAKKK